MASKIDVVSSALVLIGDAPINTLTGSGRAQAVANALYDNTVKTELSKHRWGFARKKEQISLTTDTPIGNEWQSIYQLPTDLISLIKIEPRINYQIYGDKLHCNATQAIYADYIYEAAESEWPFYFTKMVEYALALDFATSIRDSSTIQQSMAALYEAAARNARYQDSQQHPQTPIVDKPFIDVRF